MKIKYPTLTEIKYEDLSQEQLIGLNNLLKIQPTTSKSTIIYIPKNRYLIY